MPNKQQATVTLSVENWRAIMDLVKAACCPKGGDWLKWGEQINQIIQSAMDKTSGEGTAKKIEDTTAGPRRIVSFEFKKYTQTLEVQFEGGSSYEYSRVSYEIYAGLMKAESKEDYFYRVIHNAYQRKRISRGAIQKKYPISIDDPDFDSSVDEYDAHNPDFGQWIDVGGGERIWDSYVDDD